MVSISVRADSNVAPSASGPKANQGSPHVHLLGERKAVRHDPNDGGGQAIYPHGPAEDVRIPAKAALPERVVENRNGRRSVLFVGGRKVAAHERACADKAEHFP